MHGESDGRTRDRSTQIALTLGLLLFASVILGSGALGDANDLNASDENSDADRDDANDRVDLEMDRELGRENDEWGMAKNDRDWEENRIDPEVRQEMAYTRCHDQVFGTFWENTGDVLELEDGSGFEITIYDDEGNEEGWFLPPDAMWQITSGLDALVDSCADMKMQKMDRGMDRDDRRGHDRHRIDCDRIDWAEDAPRDTNDEESDRVDEDDRRDRIHQMIRERCADRGDGDDRRGHDRHRIDCDRIDWAEDAPRDTNDEESDRVDEDDRRDRIHQMIRERCADRGDWDGDWDREDWVDEDGETDEVDSDEDENENEPRD